METADEQSWSSALGPVEVARATNRSDEALWTYVVRESGAAGLVDTVCTNLFRDAGTPTPADLIDEDETACPVTSVPDQRRAALHPMAAVFCHSPDPSILLACDGVGVVVVATAAAVTRLEVAAVGGAQVRARELGRTGRFALFVAEFLDTGVPTRSMGEQRFTHTARDTDGDIIERVTLSQQDVAQWR